MEHFEFGFLPWGLLYLLACDLNLLIGHLSFSVSCQKVTSVSLKFQYSSKLNNSIK